MKFKYDLSNSFSRYMNLACGVYFKKKIIRNYKNKKTHGLVFYMIMLTLLLILMLIVVCCLMNLFNLDEANNKKIIEIFLYIFFIPCFCLSYFTISCVIFKTKKMFKGDLIVDETGIADTLYGITVKSAWEKIDSIFILDDLVVIICNNPIYQIIFVNISNHKRFINTVKKYSEETLIVDTTKK